MELHVGQVEVWPGADEAAGLGEVGGERAAAFGLQQCGVGLARRVEQRGRVGEPGEEHRRVVLQVLADRQLQHRGDLQRQQLGARADAGEQQQPRRAVGAGGEDHLALGVDRLQGAAARQLDAGGAPAAEQQPGREGAGDHSQVRPAERGVEVGDRGGAAHAARLGQLVATDALLVGAVEVVITAVAGLHRGVDEEVGERVQRASVAHLQRASAPWNWSSPRSLPSALIK